MPVAPKTDPDASLSPERSHERLYVACQLGGWVFWTVLEIALLLVRGEVTVKGEVIKSGLSATEISLLVFTNCVGLLLAHGYRQLINRQGWKQLSLLPLLPRIMVAALGFGSMWAAVALPVQYFFTDTAAEAVQVSTLTTSIYGVFNGAVFMFLWSILYFGYHVFDRNRRAEVDRWQLQSAVKEAELRALKSQINPHFIFNSLNSLRALIDENPARAREAVTQLANLLRYSLQSGQLETVPLEEEMRVVKDYLALEQVRHEERLRVRFEVGDAAALAPVPPMLVQTLVENAVKYGIAPRRDGGEIAISATLGTTGLRLTVTNPGSLSARPGSSTGMGLRNAANRLRLLFGERARLELRETAPDCVVAEVDVPIRPAGTPTPAAVAPAA